MIPSGFRPWRSDFRAAFLLAGLAGWFFWRVLTGHSAMSAVIGLAFGGVMLLAARWAWRNGMRRWHGKAVEQWAVERLGRLLDARHIPWRSGALVRGVGDVDFVATTTSGVVVVEIKSFESWRGGWLVKPGEREQHAVAQVNRQCAALDAALGYVWLPRGRATVMQRLFGVRCLGVPVVLGGEWVMMSRIRKHHSSRQSFWKRLGLRSS